MVTKLNPEMLEVFDGRVMISMCLPEANRRSISFA